MRYQTNHTDNNRIGARTAAVSFSDRPIVIHVIPRLSNSVLDTLFYDDIELANFRYEAFLELAGLHSYIERREESEEEEVIIDEEVPAIEKKEETEEELIKEEEVPTTVALSTKHVAARDRNGITPFEENPLCKARSRGYGRPDDFLVAARDRNVVTPFKENPFLKARCRGYGRPDDFLPLSPQKSILSGGSGEGSSIRIKRVLQVVHRSGLLDAPFLLGAAASNDESLAT